MKNYLHAKTLKPKLFDDIEQDDYRLSRSFLEFCAKVKSVLIGKPKTVGQIKRELNGNLIDGWLQDALDALRLAGDARLTEGILDTWSRSAPVKKASQTVGWKNGNTRLFAKGYRLKPEEIPHQVSVYGKDTRYGI